jgi:hypothetical protein
MRKKIIKYVLIVIAAIVVVAIAKNEFADSPQAALKIAKRSSAFSKAPSSLDVNFFEEKIYVYSLYYNALMPMGKLAFSVVLDENLVHLSAKATTNKTFIENFIKASASLESDVNKENFLPLSSRERTIVSGKEKLKETRYDFNELLAQKNDLKIKINDDTHDPVGAFFHLLSLPYNLGESRIVKFLSDTEIYTMKATLIRVKDSVEEFSLEIKIEDLSSNKGAKLNMWTTEGVNRIPLVFKGWMPVGYVCAILTKNGD